MNIYVYMIKLYERQLWARWMSKVKNRVPEDAFFILSDSKYSDLDTQWHIIISPEATMILPPSKCRFHFFNSNTVTGIQLPIYTLFLTPTLTPSTCLSLSDNPYLVSVCVLPPLRWGTFGRTGCEMRLHWSVFLWCLFICILCMWVCEREEREEESCPQCHLDRSSFFILCIYNVST